MQLIQKKGFLTKSISEPNGYTKAMQTAWELKNFVMIINYVNY